MSQRGPRSLLHRAREVMRRVPETEPQHVIAATAGILFLIDTFVRPLSLVALGLIVVALSPFFLKFIDMLELPGGWKVKFRDKLDHVTERAQEAGLLGEPPQGPTYYRVYNDDPTLALAGLRIEIERRVDQLVQLALMPNALPQKSSLYAKMRVLADSNILSREEFETLRDLMPLLNSAVHNQSYTRDAADWAMLSGPLLIAGLDNKIERVTKRMHDSSATNTAEPTATSNVPPNAAQGRTQQTDGQPVEGGHP